MTVEMQLLERAAERDPRPFAELYDHYVDKIYKYFYYTTRTTSDAEDMTSQVFSHAREAIAENRLKGEPLVPWLYRLAHRKLIDYYRARGKTWPVESLRISKNGNDQVVAAGCGCTTSQIHAAMQHLTPDHQQVLVLRFLQGHSTAEVAVIMNIGPDAVRFIQQDALQALQPWLGHEASRA